MFKKDTNNINVWTESTIQDIPQKKEVKLKEDNIASIIQNSLGSIIEQWLSLKLLTDKDLAIISDNNWKTILELMDYLSQYPERELLFLDKIFNDVFSYEIKKDTNQSIPVIIKELFLEWWNINAKIENKVIEWILSSTFIPFDITWDTMILLSRTPEFHSNYKDILMPIMKSRKLKKISFLLTTKNIFDFYKNSLTYNEISDEI